MSSQEGLTVVATKTDMIDTMQTEAKNYVWDAIHTHKAYKDMASFVKNKMDGKYHPNWHVVVGRSFSSYVTHENNHFAYISAGGTHFLIFKS